MASGAGKTFITIIIYVLLVAVIVGAIALIYKYTNGFNEDFKTFYVEYDGKQILTSDTAMEFEPNKKYRYDVKYTFDTEESEPKDFTVRVLPNFTKDFEFTVDDRTYLYSKAKDLTEAFEIEKSDTFFEIHIKPQSLIEILSHIYGKSDINVPTDMDEKNEYPYKLVISSYNGNVTYNIRFKIKGVSNNGTVVYDPSNPDIPGYPSDTPVTDVTLNTAEIIFTGGST